MKWWLIDREKGKNIYTYNLIRAKRALFAGYAFVARKLNQSHDCNCTVTFYLFFISLACAFFFRGMLDAFAPGCNVIRIIRSARWNALRGNVLSLIALFIHVRIIIFSLEAIRNRTIWDFSRWSEHAYASSIPFTSDFFHKFAWAIVIKVRARESESERERKGTRVSSACPAND